MICKGVGKWAADCCRNNFFFKLITKPYQEILKKWDGESLWSMVHALQRVMASACVYTNATWGVRTCMANPYIPQSTWCDETIQRASLLDIGLDLL